MLWFALVACGEDDCSEKRVGVADDETAGDVVYTADDVLEFLAGEHRFAGASASTRTAEATVEVTRGEGPVVVEDSTLIQRWDSDDLNPFVHEMDLGVESICFDRLIVPVQARVVIEEMNLDVTFEEKISPGDPFGFSELWVTGSLPADTPTLPYPPSGAHNVHVSLVVDEGGLTRFLLQWDEGSSKLVTDILEHNWYEPI